MASILCCALGLLAGSITLQIVLWRSFPIKNQPARLALIFLVLPALIVAICLASTPYGSLIPTLPWAAWCLVYLLNVSLSVSYMLLYTAVAGVSPSIAILERVEESMPKGLPREELIPHWFTDEKLAGARHKNLVSRRLVIESQGRLQLGSRGRFIAWCFLIFRRFLGLPDLARG